MERDRSTAHVRALLAAGDEFVEAASRVRAAPSVLRLRARSALEAAKSEDVTSRLRETPVESLKEAAGPGVRFGALASSGVTSVVEILRKGPDGLSALRGVGPQTAGAIWAAAEDMRTAVAADVRFRFDATAQSSTQTELLASLAALGAAGAAQREAGPRLYGLAQEVARLTQSGRPAQAGLRFRWFSRRSRRGAAHGALDELEDLLGAPSTRAAQAELAELGRAIAPESRRGSSLWDAYRRDAASINALLSALEPDFAGDADAARGFVSPQIDEAAQRVELERHRLRPSTVLRNYQVFGTRYLLSQGRAILGDEMGLGKTLQALAVIAHLAARSEADRFLVVCPAAVVVNWLNEIDKHTTVRAHALHGAGREDAGRTWLREGGIAVTTFHTLDRLPGDVREATVRLVVVDEAHLVKNPSTRTARSVRAVLDRVPRAVLLTGTPMENRVAEFRTLVDYLDPAVARRVGAHDALAGARAFRRAVSEVYLRRNQDDVLLELPERIETESWVHPTPDDIVAYREAVRRGSLTTMRRAAWFASDSAKLARLLQLIEEAAEDGLKVVVFSEFLHVLGRVEQEAAAVVGSITGSVAPAERQRLVADFSGRAGHAVLVAQILAGGVGLNMQAAAVVILAEPHWKPGIEEQAVARAHRMGQTRRVQVHRLLAKDTVDERVREVQQGKRELFDAYARRSDAKDADRAAVDTGVEQHLVAVERQRLGLG